MKKALKRSLSLLLAFTLVFGSAYVGLSEVDFGSPFAVEAKAADSKVEAAINWAVGIANDDTYGYSDGSEACGYRSRYGPDYDCSSLITTAFREAGFNLPYYLYTGNMKEYFTNAGFTWIPASDIPGFPASCANLQRGDILLNHVHHTELYLGNGQNVGAHWDWNGISGGIGGGRTWSEAAKCYRYGADEINVDVYYEYNWDGILRYEGPDSTDPQIVPVVSIDKPTTLLGADTTFSFDAEGASSVHLYIYKGTDKYYEGEFAPTETHTRQFWQTGHYSCYVVAHTTSGDVESAWVGFDVVDNPSVSISSSETTIWTDTSFTFNATNADRVILHIYQGDNKYFEGEFAHGATYTRQFGEAGGYYCYIVSHYSWGSVESEKVYFDVISPTYTVTYDANGGVNAPAPQTANCGTAIQISNVVPTRDGYDFLGWSTSSTATSSEYNPGDSYGLSVSTTLYAVWSKTHVHSYTKEVVTSPTCTESGLAKYTCTCNDTYTEEISETGHLNTTWVTEQEPTCMVDGYKDEWCLDCGEIINTEIIPANGHSYSTVWVIDVVATCTEEGSKSHKCTVCGEKGDVTVIAPLGHDFKLVSVDEGHPHTTSYKCSRCTETKQETLTLPDCALCNFTYTNIDDTTCKITGYVGTSDSFFMPGTVSGRTVTTTTTGAFKNNTTLSSVKIEDGVQGLGALAFLGCSSLSKVVIPESVTTIGANAFYNCASDFTIYCFRDSYAMQYAIDNSLNYVVMDIGETDTCTIDYTNEIIYVSTDALTSIDDILYVPADSMVFAEASLISGAKEFLGTGSTVTVFDGNDISSEYTLIVEGDTNGDSVCDALDAAQVALVMNGHDTMGSLSKLAADSNSDDEINIDDYQAIVNKVVA